MPAGLNLCPVTMQQGLGVAVRLLETLELTLACRFAAAALRGSLRRALAPTTG